VHFDFIVLRGQISSVALVFLTKFAEKLYSLLYFILAQKKIEPP